MNLTQQMHTFTNHKKCTTTQNKHKKLKPGLVASYDIWHENGEGPFCFWHFTNLSLTYWLDIYPLTYSRGAYTAHFGNDLLSQSFGVVLKKLNLTQEKQVTRQEKKTV